MPLPRLAPPRTSFPTRFLHRSFRPPQSFFSTTSPVPSAPGKQSSRMQRLHSRLPRFLQRFTAPLLSAPVTHITSFLLLHELTAVIPLFTLAGFFHYTQWLPPFLSEGKWISDGVEKFGRYFKRKGWILDDVTAGDVEGITEEGRKGKLRNRDKWWNRGEGGVRIVVEFATAYAITKVLLPARLILSVWGTPWFAQKIVVPVGRSLRRIFGGARKSGTAADSATSGSAVTRGSNTKAATDNRAVGDALEKQSHRNQSN